MITNEELLSDEHIGDVCVMYCELLGEDPFEEVLSTTSHESGNKSNTLCPRWYTYRNKIKDHICIQRAIEIV